MIYLVLNVGMISFLFNAHTWHSEVSLQRIQISKYTIYFILETENLLMPQIFFVKIRTVVSLIDISISVCNY